MKWLVSMNDSRFMNSLMQTIWIHGHMSSVIWIHICKTPHLQHPKVTHCSPHKFTNVHIVRITQWFWQYAGWFWQESPSDSDSDSDNICQNHPVILTTCTLRTTTCVKMYSGRNETVRCIIDTKLTKRIIAPAHHTTVAKHSTSVVVTSREAFCCRT